MISIIAQWLWYLPKKKNSVKGAGVGGGGVKAQVPLCSVWQIGYL